MRFILMTRRVPYAITSAICRDLPELKGKVGNLLFIEVSDFLGEVPSRFELL